MTITIKARVGNSKYPGNVAGKFYATAHARDENGKLHAGRMGVAESWPEAMQLAYKLRADLDRELMDEVHASRASRRAKRCGACRDLSNVHQYTPDCEYRDQRCTACLGRGGKHTYLDNCAEPVRNWSTIVHEFAATMAASYAADDTHTMEATA